MPSYVMKTARITGSTVQRDLDRIPYLWHNCCYPTVLLLEHGGEALTVEIPVVTVKGGGVVCITAPPKVRVFGKEINGRARTERDTTSAAKCSARPSAVANGGENGGPSGTECHFVL